MISFFRKIRHNLLNEGKTARYFKYAIGEIMLVVIGILIALQINNWNEEKKSLQKGLDILVDVRENIESNTIQFQADIDTNKNVINSIDFVLNNITVVKVYDESLDSHLRFVSWWASTRWKSSGYESLLSQGVDVLESKNLRDSIIDLYEMTYPLIEENTRLEEGNWHAMLPNWLALINREPSDFTSPDQHKASPFDYQELLESNIFRSILTFKRSQRLVDIQLRDEAIEQNRRIIGLINNELEKNK
jgi:hypothetical protein